MTNHPEDAKDTEQNLLAPSVPSALVDSKTQNQRAPHDEQLVRAWLEKIGETDPQTIYKVMTDFRQDEAARKYFLGVAHG